MAAPALLPRANHLYEKVTSRDLFGIARGACGSCGGCGKYIIVTKDKYHRKSPAEEPEELRVHPDNDPTITYCSRCGCPPEAHETVVWENERELGNDAYALHQWEAAVVHYTRAIDARPSEASLWTNRAAAFLAKAMPAQALHDAEHAASLRPEWFKAWARKGAALLSMGRAAEAEAAYQRALSCAVQENLKSPAVAEMQRRIREAQFAVKRKAARAPPSLAAKPSVPTQGTSGAAVTHNLPAVMRPQAPPVVSAPPPGGAVPFLSRPRDLKSLWAAIQEQYVAMEQQMEQLRELMAEFERRMETEDRVGIAIGLREEEWLKAGNPSLASEEGRYAELEFSTEEKTECSPPASVPAQTIAAVTPAAHEQPRVAVDGEQLQLAEEESAVSPIAGHFDGSQEESAAGMTPLESSKRSSCETQDGSVSECSLSSSRAQSLTPEEDSFQSAGRNSACAATATDADFTVPKSNPWGHQSSADGSSADEGGVQSSNSSNSEISAGDETADFDGQGSDERESEWMAAVEAARREMGAAQATSGFIPPPPSSRSRKEGASAAAPSSRIDLSSLLSMLDREVAATKRTDPAGIPRVACKSCRGPVKCPQYARASNAAQSIAFSSVASLLKAAGECCRCGCDCGVHETELEAAQRRAAEERAAQLLERRQRLREEQEREAAERMVRSAEGERSGRVAAAEARRQAAAEAEEALQSSDMDVLTQSKRGRCSACDACPGFKIYYSSTDANNPEIMFYCSLCGCKAEEHPVDAVWARQETRRKAAEAEATKRAASAQQASSSAAMAAAREEREAFATLGLPYGSEFPAAVRAFRRLALKLHPDKIKGNGAAALEAHATFVSVTQAYRLLEARKKGA